LTRDKKRQRKETEFGLIKFQNTQRTTGTYRFIRFLNPLRRLIENERNDLQIDEPGYLTEFQYETENDQAMGARGARLN
jgi:hypothetical protein